MTGAEKSERVREQAQLVVERIAQSCLDRTAYRAALRRNQGVSLDEARDVMWFRHLIAQVRREAQAEDIGTLPSDGLAFLIGTLMAEDWNALELLDGGKVLETAPHNLGASLDAVERAQDSEAHSKKMVLQPDPNRRESRFERRLRMLLDAGMESEGTGELPFRLRQAVRLVLSQRDGKLHVNWAGLLYDLRRWNWDHRPTQRDWARSFYGDPRSSGQAQTTPDDALPLITSTLNE